jgi:3-methyladenine DNA glycosylase AlkD
MLPIIDVFRANANPEQAVPMEAYQKNQFPFLGLPKPTRSALQKAWIKAESAKPELDETVIRTLWNQPEREFVYVANDLMQTMHEKLTPAHIPLIHELICTNPWWDSIDLLASNIFGSILRRHPELKDTVVRPWSHETTTQFWLARTAILAQLKFKADTDTDLLEEVIVRNKDTKEFFLNKAIGWALREYAKTNPDYVRAFVKKHRLHPLAIREALKHIGA